MCSLLGFAVLTGHPELLERAVCRSQKLVILMIDLRTMGDLLPKHRLDRIWSASTGRHGKPQSDISSPLGSSVLRLGTPC